MKTIYEVARARALISKGWKVQATEGHLFWLVSGKRKFKLYRNVALALKAVRS